MRHCRVGSFHEVEGRKQGMNNQGVEEELKYKAIRMKTESKSSYLHGSYSMPGLVLGA